MVEAIPGLGGRGIGQSLVPFSPDNRPDLQVQSTRPLGNGSTIVCDKGAASQGGGGVPGIDPANFEPTNDLLTEAFVDFACRFATYPSSAPCTFTDASGFAALIDPAAQIQFCHFMATTESWPLGDSVLTVQLRDIDGNLGPPVQIVVKVGEG